MTHETLAFEKTSSPKEADQCIYILIRQHIEIEKPTNGLDEQAKPLVIEVCKATLVSVAEDSMLEKTEGSRLNGKSINYVAFYLQFARMNNIY